MHEHGREEGAEFGQGKMIEETSWYEAIGAKYSFAVEGAREKLPGKNCNVCGNQ